MFKKILVYTVLLFLILARPSFAQSSDNDALLQQLVNKGYLSVDEADLVKQQTASNKSYQEDSLNEETKSYIDSQIKKVRRDSKQYVAEYVADAQSLQSSAPAVSSPGLDEETKKYIDTQLKKSRRDSKQYVAEYVSDSQASLNIPDWIHKIELQGEVRLRSEFVKVSDETSRQQGLIRAKIGTLAKINKQISAAVGVVTSSTGGLNGPDPRSSNISFSDGFERADIRFDYGYLEYKPTQWFKIIGGKYPKADYLWTPSDYLIDPDLNPEGAAIHLEKDLTSQIKVFNNLGAWVIDEIADQSRDLAAYYTQPGISFDNGRFDSKVSFNLMYFHHLRVDEGESPLQLDHTSCTNSGLNLIGLGTCTGGLLYDYRERGGSIELGYKQEIFKKMRRIAIYGDYIHNDLAPEKISKGFAGGLKFGDEEINGFGDWQVKLEYSQINQDAFPDAFPNSDRYQGQTAIRGHYQSLSIGLAKNVVLGLKHIRDEKISSNKSERVPQYSFQADVTVKF